MDENVGTGLAILAGLIGLTGVGYVGYKSYKTWKSKQVDKSIQNKTQVASVILEEVPDEDNPLVTIYGDEVDIPNKFLSLI